MSGKRLMRVGVMAAACAVVVAGCDRKGKVAEESGAGSHNETPGGAAAAPTNRVEIPAAVRQNLGITFAKVEPRNVAQTLRVPGRFELLPTARREFRTPLPGRVELLVAQFQRVEAGTPLYRVISSTWRDLHEQIGATQAKVDSMTPLREAHRVHERSLADKVALWQERLTQLEELKRAGGGSAAQYTEARATLNATQAELADVMEKDAELQAQQKQAEADLRAMKGRHDLLAQSSACAVGDDHALEATYVVCAATSGVVETIGVTAGAFVEENALVLTLLNPDLIRFRARGLQSDLGRLRDGLAAAIAPPSGGSVSFAEALTGTLHIGLTADADERTVDLIVQPERLASWARAGVSAHLEVTLAGGKTELAIPLSAVVRDGTTPIIFRRDPGNADKAIRLEADLGISDGRWVVIASGVKEGDEIVLGGNYQLMLATSGTATKGGHFHSDGTFHEGKD